VKCDASILLTSSSISLHYVRYSLPVKCVWQRFSPQTAPHCMTSESFVFISSPSLLQNSVYNHFCHMQSLHMLSAPPSLSLFLPPSLSISLIVLFSAEGYSCLQGYENVRKAHSIISYVNSHFPPEQTHFPGSDLLCC